MIKKKNPCKSCITKNVCNQDKKCRLIYAPQKTKTMNGVSTINCIICFKKATIIGGHVHKGEEKIIAGFCKEHRKNKGVIKNRRNCKGCYGEWKEEMGVDENFISVRYLDSNK